VSRNTGPVLERLYQALLATCVIVSALLGGTVAAHAAGTAVFSAPTPGPASIVALKPSWISVVADDATPILGASFTINGLPAAASIDRPAGHFVYDEEQESSVWVVDDLSLAKLVVYNPGNRVLKGVNTVVATVTSASGVSTYSWTFIYGTATTVGTVAPVSASVLATAPSVVTASVTSASTSFTSTMTLDGKVVAASYSAGTKTFAHTPGTALSPGIHTVSFVVRDAQGGSASKTWSFTVAPPMSSGWDCTSCHTTFPAAHKVSGCSSCHSRSYTVAGGSHGDAIPTVAGCTGDGSQQATSCHRIDHASDIRFGVWGSGPFTCADCHNVSFPAVPQHTDAATTNVHVSTTGGFCATCHTTALVTEHAKYPTASELKYQCTVCHGPSARPQVKSTIAAQSTACAGCHAAPHAAQHSNTTTACAGVGCHTGTDLVAGHAAIGCDCHSSADPKVIAAIAANDKDCDACHNPMAIHGAVHEASPTFEGVVSGYQLKCLSCHRTNLLANHGNDYRNCPTCHALGGPRSTFTAWDKTCMTGACHPTQTPGVNTAPHPAQTRVMNHELVADGVQPPGYCQSCHGNPVGNQCGAAFGCHSGAVPPVTSVDFTPPTTTASMNGTDPVVWKLDATDTGDGVTATYYSFDGSPFALYGETEKLSGLTNPADADEPYAHVLRYYSKDAAGNVEATKTKSYNVTDFTPPAAVFSGVSLPSGATVATSSTMFVADPIVKGRNTGVASIHLEFVTFYIVFGNWTMAPYPVYQPYDISYPLDSSWDQTRTITGLDAIAQSKNSGNWVAYSGTGASGRFMVKYTTTDYTGNVSDPVMTTLTIDNAAPVTTISTPTAGEYRWKLATTDSAPFTTHYSFDGAPFVVYDSADASSGIVNTRPGGTNLGSHTLRYYSEDALGNLEATKTHTYSITETTPPVASLSATMTPNSVVISMWDPAGSVQRSGVKSIVGRVYQGGVSKTITTTFPAGDPSAVRSLEVTVPSDGGWTLDYYVYDWDGNRTWYYQSFHRDTTPPSSGLGGGWNTQWQLSAGDGFGSGVGSVNYRFDDGAYTQVSNPTGFVYFTTPTQLMTKYGAHTLWYYAVDKFGFAETPKSTSWTVPDTTKPTITLVKPTGAWVRSAYLGAQDTGSVMSGLKEIHYRLNYGTWVTVPFDTSVDPAASVQADLAALPNGVVSVEYYAVDVAGNTSATTTGFLNVDNAAPTVSVTQQYTNPDGSVVVRIAASEVGSGSGVDRCFYEYTDATGFHGGRTISGTTAEFITLRPPITGGVVASVSAYARDYIGNESASVPFTTMVSAPLDLFAPVSWSGVDGEPSLSSADGTLVFGIYSNDDLSGVASTFYKLDDGDWQSGPAQPETLVTVSGYGTHTLSYYSVDYAGNTENVQVKTFDVVELATLSFRMVNSLYPNVDWMGLDYSYDVELYEAHGWLEDAWSGTTRDGDALADTDIRVPTYDSAQPWRVRLVIHTKNMGDQEWNWWNVNAVPGVTVELSGEYNDSLTGSETDAPVTTSDAQSVYSVTEGQTTLISLNAADTGGSGVANTYYELDSTGQAEGTAITVAAPASAPEEHTLRFWSVDNAGNVETAQSVTFTVEPSDSTPPTTTSDAQAAYSATATIVLVSSDDYPGVKDVYYRLDGGNEVIGTMLEVPNPPSGSVDHTLTFWATDHAGNTESPTTVNFTVKHAEFIRATFDFTGSDGTFTVPAGVTKLTVDLYGAQGGGSGGLGGSVHAVIPVTPGEELTVRTGGQGATDSWGTGGWGLGGYPNGGAGYFVPGGGGGGSSSLLRGSDVLVEAGGGGGCGTDGAGGEGGAQGSGPGGNEVGGSGQEYTAEGGGGGGWNAGPAGLPWSAGGGGTSFIAFGAGSLAPGVQTGNGLIIVSWPDDVAPVTTADAATSYTLGDGESATINLTASDVGGTGVATTYYQLDAEPQAEGVVVTVPSSASGIEEHMLRFWSADNAGNLESVQMVMFTVEPS